jgi:ParB/RepB/Spo0J family partition protein
MAQFQIVPIKKVRPNRLNPRMDFRKEGLDQLAASISRVGLLEPILVRSGGGAFEVVVGERRYRAALQVGLDAIPALVGDYSDEQVIEMNLIENVQREDLNDVEKGKCCVELLEKYPEDYPNAEAIADRLDVTPRTVNNWIQTARELSPQLQRLVAPPTERGKEIPKGKITSGTALNIVRKIPEKDRQVEVARALADRQVTSDDAREILKKVAREPTKPVQRLIREVAEAPPEIPFRLKHAEMIKKGAKTQTSRKGLRDPAIKPGATFYASVFEPKYVRLKVKGVERKRLGEFSSEDAKREGGYTLQEFKRVWEEIHEDDWDDNETVYVINFEVAPQSK